MRDIRLDITQKCNLDCIYCHHEGMKNYTKEMLDASDYEFLSETITETTSINSYTITGGEPLIRTDLMDVLKLLDKPKRKITLITNGVLLKKNIGICNYVDEIHVSIPSLNPIIYSKITQHNLSYLDKVKEGIEKAKVDFPHINMKINVCLVKNINDDKENLEELFDFSKKYKLEPRLIQVMLYEELRKPLYEIETLLKQDKFEKFEENNRVSSYKFNGIDVKFIKCTCDYAILKPNPAEFCNKTIDISITPSGELKVCFLKDETIDLLPEIKNREMESLSEKIKLGIESIGKNCPLVKK